MFVRIVIRIRTIFSHLTRHEYFPCLCNPLKAVYGDYIMCGTCGDLLRILPPVRCQGGWVEFCTHPDQVYLSFPSAKPRKVSSGPYLVPFPDSPGDLRVLAQKGILGTICPYPFNFQLDKEELKHVSGTVLNLHDLGENSYLYGV